MKFISGTLLHMNISAPKIPVTVLTGDGIGPEVVNSAMRLLDAAGAPIDYQPAARQKMGADVFIESNESPENIASQLQLLIKGTPYTLKMISNRGTQVWPATGATPTCVDHYRCRFIITDRAAWHPDSILGLLERVGKKFRWMHAEKLENLDGVDVFTKAQGEN